MTYPKERWSHYDGWPTQERWSHYDGWPTQVKKMMVSLWWVTYPKKDGLIMMGDLPRWKIEKIWSGLIIMGDLPKWKEYEVRSHYNGWPTQKKMMVLLWRVTYPEKWWKVVSLLRVTYPKIECDLPGKKTWPAKSWQDKADKRRFLIAGWLEDSFWWQGWSPRFFEIFLLAGFISFLSHSRI
jgi:hypothetical protein